jgi:UDP-N-acetylmuramoyl-L-alanyl-D-glutamate--2,6-diaminopimelate ligase
VPKVIRYGIKQSHVDLKATNIKSSADGNAYEVKYEGQVMHIEIGLPGLFNVSNSLAAVGVGLALGLDGGQIERGLAAVGQVEGRMNSLELGQDFGVIVDFAHTPNSFDRILSSMREISKGRMIVVFGSAGRRDESKRAKQGTLAGKWADLVVVTEEDDRDVDGDHIMGQIAEGAIGQGKQLDKDLFLIHDRTKAISYAISQARKGDLVLLLGKGHEKTIERADGEHPWDETAVATAAIKARLKKAAK